MINTLIVEDSNTYRKALKRVLYKAFPEMIIEEAVNGGEANRKINSRLPDLILMDIALPDKNGLSLTKEIKDRHPETPVVIITNHDYPVYREAALESGAKAFLSKTWASPNEIVMTIAAVLRDMG